MRLRLLALVLLLGLSRNAIAQTPADTAAVVLEVARNLEREGKRDAARELFQYLRARYGATTAARAADSLLRLLPALPGTGNGRTGFVTFNTVYGGFLGVAIPAALDADGGGAYGVGLLIGAPAGFFISRAFARKHFRSSGQAGLASFATVWGTWQGLGWQQALKKRDCPFGCYSGDSDRAPWAAMAVGGVAGIAAGWAIASSREIRPGTATMVSNSAFWGTWYGLALAQIAGTEDGGTWASMVIAGNAALLAAIPASRAWRPSSARVRLISAGGLAGGLAGFGVDLIASFDSDEAVFAVPAITSALGLLTGAMATKDRGDPDGGGELEHANAVLGWDRGLRLGFVMPEPAAFRIEDRAGKSRLVPGARLRLFEGKF